LGSGMESAYCDSGYRAGRLDIDVCARTKIGERA
jgi:hypothetical protein